MKRRHEVREIADTINYIDEEIKKAAKLILCILVILIFIFYIGPLIEKLPLVQPLVQVIDERDIDASALYYTEIEEFSEANTNMENTMKYPALEIDKQK